MSSSLWSGTTEYLRGSVPFEGKLRDVWYPAGYGPSELVYCWRVKQDSSTGKYFFVNLGGLGKRWRLPDLYDPAVQAELHLAMVPPPMSSTSQHATTTVSASVVEAAAPRQVVVQAPISASTPVSHEAVIAPQISPVGLPSSSTPVRAPSPGPSKQLAPSVRQADVSFDADEMSRKRMEAEKQVLDEVRAYRANLLASTERTASGMAADSPVAAKLETAQMIALQEQRRMLEIAARKTEVIAHQQLALDAACHDEFADIAQLEREHSEQVHREAEELRQREASVARQEKQKERALSSSLARREEGEGTSTAVVVAKAPAHENMLMITLEQLEYERKSNERLHRQLEEKDALLLRHMMSDVEREKREVAARMKMLETLVAYRKRVELLEQQKQRSSSAAADADKTANSITSGTRRRYESSAPRYIPPHPLMEADFPV